MLQLALKSVRESTRAMHPSTTRSTASQGVGVFTRCGTSRCYHTTHGTEPTLDSRLWRYGTQVRDVASASLMNILEIPFSYGLQARAPPPPPPPPPPRPPAFPFQLPGAPSR